jgi:hypothetical protein
VTGEGGRDRPLSLSRVTGVCEGDLLSGERLTAGAVVERESFPFCYRSSALVPTYGAGQGSNPTLAHQDVSPLFPLKPLP